MIADLFLFIVYAAVLSALVYYTGFFKLFDDDTVSRKKITLLFLGKILSVPAFLFVYTKMYGGIENFDTGKFYHDVKVICDYGKTDLSFLIRLLFGFQDDSKGSADYNNVLVSTLNWDNGTVKDYLYNDNRVVIRTHILLNLVAFNSYPVHALLNCFLSFIGILFFYKTFKEWFPGKEISMLLTLCFFPALWFFTGALLKEGITFFVLGCMLYQLKLLIIGPYKTLRLPWLLFLLFTCFLLKPYLLLFAALFFALFFYIQHAEKIKWKALIFISSLVIIVILVNLISMAWKDRSLLEAALKHQHRFIGVSKGGIFLSDSVHFIRLSNDTNQVKKIKGTTDLFTIKENASYMYWKTVDQRDTLYAINKDTSKIYKLAYIIQPGQSNINLPVASPLKTVFACLYYTLFYPTFYSARNALQLLASLENILVLFSILILLIGFIKSKKERFLPLAFLCFALSLCLLIGLTAPNSGAIFRYRSPAMVFLLLSALYYFEDIKSLFKGRNPLSS